MTVAVLPASFDPITCGHVDIATRSARLFDRLVVAVHAHPKKNLLFSVDERLEMVRESVRNVENIEVTAYDGLTVDFCRSIGATVLVRGLRAVSDFEQEYQQATLNRKMLPGLEVICVFASDAYSFLSSSIIKEIAENGGDVTEMVPAPVVLRLRGRFGTPSPLHSGGG